MITDQSIRDAIDSWFGPTPPVFLAAECETFQGVVVFERLTPVRRGPMRIGMAVGEGHQRWLSRTLPFSSQPSGGWAGARAVGFARTKQEALALLFPNEQGHLVTEKGVVQTALGPALRIQIERRDHDTMGFREIWDVFEHRYPGKWALQCFPPREHFIDQANRYHLHVLDVQPQGLDLFDVQDSKEQK
jgi:hypothetical protein